MSIWESYQLNDSIPWWDLAGLPRSAARAEFDRKVADKDRRIAVLRDLLGRFGVSLDRDDSSIQRLNDWFIRVVESLPNADLPNGRTLSICEDVALYLGECAIERDEGLHWEFFVWGRRNVAYHAGVIMGFSDDPKWRTNFDLTRMVCGYGELVVQRRVRSSLTLKVPERPVLNGVEFDLPPVAGNQFVKLLESISRQYRSAV